MTSPAATGPMSARLPYRDELDGLRAIAVLAVLGYHAGYNNLGGGFVGVDVFLVLSGYLITQQVTALQARGGFSLPAFWLRRARRLIPAMVPVLVFATLAALVLKGDGGFHAHLGHALSAGAFVSNYLFLSQADYFAPASDTNLLLHSWSLSLEMQFYLLMPLVLMALARAPRGLRIAALAALAAASLALAEALIRSGQGSWAFYGILPRFWEFAAGGIAALLPRLPALFPGFGALLRAAGLALILWVVGAYAGTPFPGLGAALPVLGTLLILAAPGTGRDPLRWLLESRGMRWIGLRSYAIYLVHWPLYVAVTPSAMNRSEDVLSVALLVSLLLGHLIYRYVERPLREGARFATPRAMGRGALGYIAGTAAVLGLLATPLADGLRGALPLAPLRSALTTLEADRAAYMAALDHMTDPAPGTQTRTTYCSYDRIATAEAMTACLMAAPENAILVIGDSHGRDALLALELAFPDRRFAMMHQSSCSAARYFDRSWCFETLPEVLDRLAAAGRLDRVILSARWGFGSHVHTGATLEQLAALGARTAVIGPAPTYRDDIEVMVAEAAFRGEDLRETGHVPVAALAFDVAGAEAALAEAAARTGAGYSPRYGGYCDAEICRVTLEDGSGYVLFDNQHLTWPAVREYAADLVADPVLLALLGGT